MNFGIGMDKRKKERKNKQKRSLSLEKEEKASSFKPQGMNGENWSKTLIRERERESC